MPTRYQQWKAKKITSGLWEVELAKAAARRKAVPASIRQCDAF